MAMRCAVNGEAGGLVPMTAAGRLAAALKQITNHQTGLMRFTEQTTAENDSPDKLKTDARVGLPTA